jgi:hypothetical protein
MAQASERVLAKCGVTPEQIDLVIPHQANLRIIESVAKHARIPMEKVYVTVQRYGNMSRDGAGRTGRRAGGRSLAPDADAGLRRWPDPVLARVRWAIA